MGVGDAGYIAKGPKGPFVFILVHNSRLSHPLDSKPDGLVRIPEEVDSIGAAGSTKNYHGIRESQGAGSPYHIYRRPRVPQCWVLSSEKLPS